MNSFIHYEKQSFNIVWKKFAVYTKKVCNTQQMVWEKFRLFNVTEVAIYRLFHDLWTLLQEVIS
jgi:hypothetical protein